MPYDLSWPAWSAARNTLSPPTTGLPAPAVHPRPSDIEPFSQNSPSVGDRLRWPIVGSALFHHDSEFNERVCVTS